MASVTIPYSFTNGYAADANEVNANFAALKAFVDASLVQTDGSQVNAATSVTKAMLVAAVQESIAPAGSILLYGGSSAPTGWLICNGATLSTTTYATLFAVVGYTYGGSGGNFLLPSMTNKFAFGGTPGVGTGSTTIAEANLPVHSHANTAAFTGTSSQPVTTTSTAHTHNVTSNVSATFAGTYVGDHAHSVYTENKNIVNAADAAWGVPVSAPGSSYLTANAGAHTPAGSVSVTNNAVTSGAMSANASHDHTVTATGTVAMTNATTGSGTAYYQPHVVFNYIIKS